MTMGFIPFVSVSVQMLSLLVFKFVSCDEISFGYLEYPPSSSACFPVFSKNIKVFWENISVFN